MVFVTIFTMVFLWSLLLKTICFVCHDSLNRTNHDHHPFKVGPPGPVNLGVPRHRNLVLAVLVDMTSDESAPVPYSYTGGPGPGRSCHDSTIDFPGSVTTHRLTRGRHAAPRDCTRSPPNFSKASSMRLAASHAAPRLGTWGRRPSRTRYNQDEGLGDAIEKVAGS